MGNKLGYVIALLCVLSIGCARSLNLTGKQCPCVGGYVCNEATNICVPEGTLDASTIDTAASDADTPIVPVSLALGWSDHYGERSHSCVVFSDGGLRCWGQSEDRQLGYDRTTALGDDELPTDEGLVEMNAKVIQVAAGAYHTCALLEDGTVRCWGGNSLGQLGQGNVFPTPEGMLPKNVAPVELGEAATQIATGAMHTCALLQSAKVRCWGKNASGQLGLGHTDDYGDEIGEIPANQPALTFSKKVIQITAAGSEGGDGHTCALLEDGTVRCWGDNKQGQLGYGHTDPIGDDPERLPAAQDPVSVGGPVIAIAAGDYRTCAILENKGLVCWGNNYGGELGQGNTDNVGDTELPSEEGWVATGGAVTGVALGQYHTCALLENHTVRCWGGNYFGQLGWGDTNDFGSAAHETPLDREPVNIGAPVMDLAAGYLHTCALLDDHTVRCWGGNNAGELGYGNTDAIGDNELPYQAGPVSLQ